MTLSTTKMRAMLGAMVVWFLTSWLGIHGHIVEDLDAASVAPSSMSVHLDLCEDDEWSHAAQPHVDVDMGLDHLVLKFFSLLLPALVVVFTLFLLAVRAVPEWLALPRVHTNSVLHWRPSLRAPPVILA